MKPQEGNQRNDTKILRSSEASWASSCSLACKTGPIPKSSIKGQSVESGNDLTALQASKKPVHTSCRTSESRPEVNGSRCNVTMDGNRFALAELRSHSLYMFKRTKLWLRGCS